MNKLLHVLFVIITLLWANLALAQNEQDNWLQHEMTYNCEHQDMWGPGEGFSLDFDYEIIDIAFNESDEVGVFEDIFGQTFGVGFSYGIWGYLNSTFSIHGFTLGYVDVNYPVEINLDFPDDYSFDMGEPITIESWYDVLDGYYLNTQFPQAGVISLDLEYGFGMHMDVILCMFGCETIPLMPSFNIPSAPVPGQPLPHDSIAIFYLNGETGEVVYPCLDPVTGLPDFCEDDLLPIIIPDWFNIGLTGEIDLPNVETEDWLDNNTQCLEAYGQDDWISFELNVMTFLSAIANAIPPPYGPQIAEVIDILDGGTITYEIMPGVEAIIDYYILHCGFLMTSWMTQEFSFCPDIYATLGFPSEMPYEETNPGNELINAGTDDTITFLVNNDLTVTYPCYDWDSMEVSVEYDFVPTFSNHTWDSLAFDFYVSVLWLHVTIPFSFPWKETEVPEFELPEIVYQDKPSGSTQALQAKAPAYTTPEIEMAEYVGEKTLYEKEIKNPVATNSGLTNEIEDPSVTVTTKMDTTGEMATKDLEFEIGPIFEDTIPLGYIPINWFDETWELECQIQDTPFPGTTIIPNPPLDIEIEGNDILCYGDTSGVITVTAISSSGPYTWEYSNGMTNTHMDPVDSIIVPAGYYYVTLTDVWGCTVGSEMNVANIYPPIESHLYADDVLCYGEPTGAIYSTVMGGLPPYTYEWQPSGSTDPNPIGLYAGWHYLTVTDAVDCEHYDSIFIDEPDAPIEFDYDFENVTCFGANDGWIDVTVTGGTPPYFFEWSNGQLTEDLINLPDGAYNLSVTDSHGCEAIMGNAVIIQPDPLIATTELTHVGCFDGNDGTIDLTVTGGTQPYSYEWSNGATSEDLTGVPAGLYFVTVTDAMGCLTVAYAQIDEPDLPLTGMITPTHVRCFGEANGIADLEVYGGTPPYFYNWSTGEISEDIAELGPGDYYVTITDAHGCLDYAYVHIHQPDAPLSMEHEVEHLSCGNAGDGSIHIYPDGGTPPYHYQWSNGSWDQHQLDIPAGTYTVTVTDDHYCHLVETIEVTQPDPLVVESIQEHYICFGQTVQIGIDMVSGGVPPYEVYWEHNGLTVEHMIVEPDTTTTYTAIVTDATGCTSDPVDITVNVFDSVALEVSAEPTIVCPGDSVFFEFDITGVGDTVAVVLNHTDSIIHTPFFIANPVTDSVFNFTVYDKCHFDSVSVDVPIQIFDLPPVAINADVTDGCQPLTVHFSETSPHEGQQYIWDFDDGDVENLSFDKNPIHTFNNPTTYFVNLLVRSDVGCEDDSTIAITVFPKPNADFTASKTNVSLSNPLISFRNYTEGGYFYHWNFDDGAMSDKENPQHAYSDPGKYTVLMETESLYGCKDTAMVEITVSGEMTLYAPTAFTPNHDDVNEIFRIYIQGYDIESYHLEIYNRWGEPVFVSNDPEIGWDGTSNEKDNPEGVYTWYFEFDDFYGNIYVRSGQVTLIR